MQISQPSPTLNSDFFVIPPVMVNQKTHSIDYIQLLEGPTLCVCPYCQNKVMTKVQDNWKFKSGIVENLKKNLKNSKKKYRTNFHRFNLLHLLRGTSLSNL